VLPDRWRQLKDVHPIDRVYVSKPKTQRRAPKSQKHVRTGPQHETVGVMRTRSQVALNLWSGEPAHRRVFNPAPTFKLWHTTQRPPWKIRAENRASNRRGRLSRKVNRA
jgi:hypothetical protein